MLYDSIYQKLLPLGEHVVLWPAHGAKRVGVAKPLVIALPGAGFQSDGEQYRSMTLVNSERTGKF